MARTSTKGGTATAERYLVTGCAGLIGWRVTEFLLEAGHEVVGADNLNDSYDPRLKRWRLERLQARPGLVFHIADIADREAADVLFASAGQSAPFSAVIHLAARVGVRESVENPWIYQRTNVEGTLNLLESCRRRGVRKFVLASTSSVYGAGNPLPYREDSDTSWPLSPYTASKKAAEVLAHSYHHLHGLDVSVLRYFTVYGPAGRPDMSIARFIRRIAEGEPITVFGDGTQSRDFTYLDDIARGTIASLAPLGYATINLGAGRQASLAQVIHQIARLLDREAKIRYAAAHPADLAATWADIDTARRLLGWQPEVALEEGLRRAVEWYRENRDLAATLNYGD